MHQVPFVSQRTYAFPHVSCGVAATMMLLKFHIRRKRVPSYGDLRKALGVYVLNSESGRRRPEGVTLDDVTGYLRRQAIRYRTTNSKSRNTWTILERRLRRAPVIVGMGSNVWRWGTRGHWIVVIDVSADTVSFLDSQNPRTHRRPTTMPLARFRRQWDGSSLQIVGCR
ncbi:MAG TPA: hypothetical protein VGK32_17055 [Vicinamibacterales bacterium]|jgi:hypothetical protein